jgi:FkbM family methyltransferase
MQLEQIVMRNQILKFIRKKEFQPIWEKLFHVSKVGMNFWGGSSLFDSGEISAMKYAYSKLRNDHKLVIFDVGANYGEFAFLALKLFSSKKIIYSFEPSEHTFNDLTKALKENNALENVMPYHFGFGEKNEKLKLYTAKPGASTASIYKDDALTNQLCEEINIRTIDGFCLENNIQNIDFLKIDIEGHEYHALLGAKEMIKNKKVKYIMFEFGEGHIKSRTFFKDFYDFLGIDYRLFRIVPNGIRPISAYTTDLEVFNTINYLAELK